ncbi:hypothetical protein MYCTH_2122631 [Thermothelomyces thermophilus ATCC 42464]|uniref:Uncharacterized protein n=1 Tax=Thermothelomyces thermophilus (strain ATCC 42464 / BCRC 31852 / DSM 1799) TaxID=573729 RepID=G2Q5D2_THET4|nr:uncharacterized protein MYCTH_2122631 [Thermothelomyces thermophilus ATCC 42464]AEO53763.1 hypothetical protein MYCTH_2122631 [Thermothelomyces thermophilus ATCC 42464]
MRTQPPGYASPPAAMILTVTKLHAIFAVHSLLFLLLLLTSTRPNITSITDDTTQTPTHPTTPSAFETAPVATLAYCLHLWCATLGFAWWCAAQCAGDDHCNYGDRRGGGNNGGDGGGDGEENEEEVIGGGKRGSAGRAAQQAADWEPAIFLFLCAGMLGALGGHAVLAGRCVSGAAKAAAATAATAASAEGGSGWVGRGFGFCRAAGRLLRLGLLVVILWPGTGWYLRRLGRAFKCIFPHVTTTLCMIEYGW